MWLDEAQTSIHAVCAPAFCNTDMTHPLLCKKLLLGTKMWRVSFVGLMFLLSAFGILYDTVVIQRTLIFAALASSVITV